MYTIKNSSTVFINTIMPNLYNSLSIVLLGFWGGSVANGKFDAGVKLPNIFQGFISIVTRVFFPYLSRKADYHQTYAKLNIVTASVIAFILFIGSPFIIKILFTNEFLDSIIVMQIISISLVFLTLSEVYGTNYMIVKGYERELRRIIVAGSIIGFLIALPLVYFFSYVGAALVITITRGILGFWTMREAKYIQRNEQN
jgi:PST family polysaccharide transporter